MNRRSLIRAHSVRAPRSRLSTPRLFRPQLEALERRELLAADTFWTLDSAQSFITLAIPNQPVTIPDLGTLTIGFRNQTGSISTPWNTNTTHIAGQIATNYTDGSSIEFVASESSMAAIASGNYRPNPAAFNPLFLPKPKYMDTSTAPAEIGAKVYTPSIANLPLGYVSISNLIFDAASTPLAISGTTFAADTTSFGTLSGLLGFDADNPFNALDDSLGAMGSLSATNTSLTGSIASSMYQRQLTLPLNVPVTIALGTSILSATISGQIVATHELNHPPAVDPNGADPGDYVATWAGAPVAIVDATNTPSGATVTDFDDTNLASLTVALSESGGTYIGGNQLTVNTGGTSIVATPFDGTSLVLSGTDTLANYQQVLRTIQYTNTLGTPGLGVLETVTYTAVDPNGGIGTATSTINIQSATTTGRHLFYNQSSFDGATNALQSTNDDLAIAPDKTAYLPNNTNTLAVFANVSSFSRGINGIMVDLAGPGLHTSINANDFVFKHGNNNSPNLWAAVTATPTISVRVGAGTLGSDRVTITWASNSIKNEWLEVQVLPTVNTGLTAADVFFWGSKTGDVGAATPASQFLTSATDKTSVVNNQVGGVPITNTRDFNRDGNVTAADATTVIGNQGTIERLLIGLGGPFAPEGDGSGSAVAATITTDVGVASALAANSTTTSSAATWQPVAVAMLRRVEDAARTAAYFSQWPDAVSPKTRKPFTVDEASVDASYAGNDLLDELAAGLRRP